MGVLSNVMRTNKSNPIQLKFFQGQHQSHPHINIAIRRMWSYFWSGAHLLQNIISRGLRSHWVSPSEWWWWSSWSWWSKWSTGLSGPHLLFGVFIIIRKVSFLLFHLYISVRFQICFFNKFTRSKITSGLALTSKTSSILLLRTFHKTIKVLKSKVQWVSYFKSWNMLSLVRSPKVIDARQGRRRNYVETSNKLMMLPPHSPRQPVARVNISTLFSKTWKIFF